MGVTKFEVTVRHKFSNKQHAKNYGKETGRLKMKIPRCP
jgi:hypothetical protein